MYMPMTEPFHVPGPQGEMAVALLTAKQEAKFRNNPVPKPI